MSDLYKGLLASPTVKNLQSGLSTGWSTVKESFTESWGVEALREHEAQAASQAAAWRKADQEIEKRALESENFHSYSRNADLQGGELGSRFVPRRSCSLKAGSMGAAGAAAAGVGFQPYDDMRPRANSDSFPTGDH